MPKKLIYTTLWLLCFLGGIYIWKVQRTGRSVSNIQEAGSYLSSDRGDEAFVYVADVPISTGDVEFEYQLHTKGINEPESMTPIPALSGKIDTQLAPLRQRLASGIVERKALYKFIEQDQSFDLTNPSRYRSCVKDWQEVIDKGAEFADDTISAERLKVRICELDIIHQYLTERVYPKAAVVDQEINDFYKANPESFKEKDRIVVRHILLGNEQEAKKVRYRLTQANFEEVARKQSLAPEAVNGGLLGPYARGEYPSIFDVAFSMRNGEISTVLKSNYGFHILMVTKKLPRTTLTLAEAKARIKKQLMMQKQEEEYQKWVELALNSVKIQTPKPLW